MVHLQIAMIEVEKHFDRVDKMKVHQKFRKKINLSA